MGNEGIPTNYRSFRFRSRLEATWSVFFDRLGWEARWKYEPFDYDGYIPDFALVFPAGNVLVEVKPCLTLGEMKRHTEKIDRSPWSGEALILGVGLISAGGNSRYLGLHGCLDYDPQAGRVWEPAVIHRCRDHVGFHAEYAGWWCRHGEECDHHDFDVGGDWFDEQWALAQNLVQWSPEAFTCDLPRR